MSDDERTALVQSVVAPASRGGLWWKYHTGIACTAALNREPLASVLCFPGTSRKRPRWGLACVAAGAVAGALFAMQSFRDQPMTEALDSELDFQEPTPLANSTLPHIAFVFVDDWG